MMCLGYDRIFNNINVLFKFITDLATIRILNINKYFINL